MRRHRFARLVLAAIVKDGVDYSPWTTTVGPGETRDVAGNSSGGRVILPCNVTTRMELLVSAMGHDVTSDFEARMILLVPGDADAFTSCNGLTFIPPLPTHRAS